MDRRKEVGRRGGGGRKEWKRKKKCVNIKQNHPVLILLILFLLSSPSFPPLHIHPSSHFFSFLSPLLPFPPPLASCTTSYRWWKRWREQANKQTQNADSNSQLHSKKREKLMISKANNDKKVRP